MRKILLITMLLSTLIALQSCQKEHACLPKTYPIVGLWIGTYKVTDGGKDVGTDNLYYSYDIRQDSSIIVQSLGADGNTYYAVGNWSVVNDIFTAKYTTQNLGQTGVVQDATATYSNKTGVLSEGIVKTQNSTFEALITLNRIN